MINEFLWVLLLIGSFIGTILSYRFFGKTGLFVWIAMSIILTNIQVMKTVEIFSYVTALGNIVYGSIYLAIDILNENHGRKEAQKAVWVGFFVLLSTTVIMQIALRFIPHESDFLSPALEQIFGFLPRIAVASFIAYFISQFFNVAFYNFIKKLTKKKHLWIRNNLSTMASQLLDNIIFTWIAFIGFFGFFGWEQIFSWDIVFQIFFVSLIMKYVVAVFDTPFIYLARRMKKKVASL